MGFFSFVPQWLLFILSMKRLPTSCLIIVYSTIKCITLLFSRVIDLHFLQTFVDLNNVSIAETHEIIKFFLLLLYYCQWHNY